MDRLDIRILRELTQAHTVWPARPGPISSYRYVARKLGIAPGTARHRVLRMVHSGFLQRTLVFANPSLLGMRSASYALEVAPGRSKADVVDRVAAVEGVVFLENFHGPLLGLGLFYETAPDLARLLDRLDSIAGAARGLVSAVEQPPSSGPLTSAEWTLVSRLMERSFRSHLDLARELRTSVRTLKRRLARLTCSGAVLTFPQMDYRALDGGVTAELLVGFSGPAARAGAEPRVMAALENWLIYAGIWEAFTAYRLIVPNIALAAELGRSVERMDAVTFARLEFVESLLDRTAALRPYVERKAAEARGGSLEPARASGRARVRLPLHA